MKYDDYNIFAKILGKVKITGGVSEKDTLSFGKKLYLIEKDLAKVYYTKKYNNIL